MGKHKHRQYFRHCEASKKKRDTKRDLIEAGAHMAVTVEQVERIAEKLRSLPPIENKKRVVSKQESIKMLTSEIAGLRERGYTLDQIAELLAADQLEIGAPPLKSFLQLSPKPSSEGPCVRPNAVVLGTPPGDVPQAQPASES